MIKTIATLFAAAVSFGAYASDTQLIQADIGVDVPVEMVVPATITQVVAFDGVGTYVMATEQKVDTLVQVTPEMAGNAIAFNIAQDTLPEIFSVDQASNSGLSEGSFTPFAKTGMIEPIAVSKTVVNKVFFKYGNDTYAVETTADVGDSITLSRELMAKAQKI